MPTPQNFWKTQEEQLKRKLDALEERVEIPLVPGEFEDWLNQVGQAFEDLAPQLQLQTRHIHAEEFAEIAEEDPGLLGRVESMQKEDRSLTLLCGNISAALESLKHRYQQGASETDLKQDVDDFVSKCLDFVMRIRKQEVTVRTWLVEAFNRDRGDVD